VKLGIQTIRSDQHDFLHCRGLPIGGQLDPTIMGFGARRQDLDDQERILDRLAPDFIAPAGPRNVGFELGIHPV